MIMEFMTLLFLCETETRQKKGACEKRSLVSSHALFICPPVRISFNSPGLGSYSARPEAQAKTEDQDPIILR